MCEREQRRVIFVQRALLWTLGVGTEVVVRY